MHPPVAGRRTIVAMAAGKLLIGWGNADVTPDRPANLYGQFHARIATQVLDPLTVTALALQSEADPEAHVVFVACDRCTIPATILARCQAAVAERCPDLRPEALVLHATHTHTSPVITDGCFPPDAPEVMTPTEYAEVFVAGVADAVAIAWQSRAPGAVAWGLGHAVIGHNRRTAYSDDLSQRPGYRAFPGGATDGHTRMYGNTNDPLFSHVEGHADHSVDLLYCTDADGRLTGVVVNLACPSQETEGISQVSADFWHDVRLAIKAQLGEQVQVLGQCSAAGDQSPHLLYYKRAEERMLALRGNSSRTEIARRLASTVAEVLPVATTDLRHEVPLRVIRREIAVPVRRVSDDEYAQAKADLAHWEAQQPADAREESCRFVAANRCRRVIARYERQQAQPTSTEVIHVVRLGDVAFATNRFELYLDYGVRMKARSAAVQTFVVQLAAGGAYTGTYLPTARSEAGRSYGAGVYCNEIGSEGGQVLVEETLTTIGELFAS